MNELKNLLALSKNALQLCHDEYGMDFEKPYTIIEGKGKFTINSIGKLILEKTGFTYKDAATVFFMENTNKYNSGYVKLYYVRLYTSFEPVDTLKMKSRYQYIDDYYRKSDFESDRKKGEARYWIVVQDKKYFASGETYIADLTNDRFTHNYGERYRLISDSRKEIIYTASWYGRNKPVNILDKSGYLRWNNVIKYQTKARALKAERNKAAANVYSCSAENAKIEQAIKTIRTRIAEKVLSGADAYDLSWILGKMNSLERYYKIHCEKITKKSYNSVDAIKRELNDLNEYVTDINAKLDNLK